MDTTETAIELLQLMRDAIKELGECRGIFLYSVLRNRIDRAEYERLLKILENEGLIAFSTDPLDDVIYWTGGAKRVHVPLNIRPSERRLIRCEKRIPYLGYFISKTNSKWRPWVVEKKITSGYVTAKTFADKQAAVVWIDAQ